MRIAVIGAGHVGGTLGRRWAAAGHAVTFGVRDPGRGDGAVQGGPLKGGPLPAGARVTSPAEAVRGAEAVLLATPWGAVPDAVRAVGAGALDGVPVLDATNPLGPDLGLVLGPQGESGGERVQALAPGARVVKVFNTTGYENMRDPASYPGGAVTMCYAGDDAGAKAVAHRLAADLGFTPVDAGPLARSRELEHLAALWIGLAYGAGAAPLGTDFAFQLVRRDAVGTAQGPTAGAGAAPPGAA